jgi:cytochrome c-type biogenesis protein CcmH
MLFWIIAGLIAIAATGLLVAPLRRSGGAGAPAQELAIYRDQLAEVDRDLARGTLDSAEAERARTEIARRLLAADRAGPAATAEAPGRPTTLLAAVTALLLVLGGVLAYAELGAPGYPDLPRSERLALAEQMRATRPSQAEAETAVAAAGIQAPPLDDAYQELMEQLRSIVASRADDLEGWTLLSQHEMQTGNFAAAARAQEHVIALKGDGATADDLLDLVNRLVAAAGGQVSPEAEAVLDQILDRDEDNPGALYFTGLLYAQTGRADIAFRLWRPLVEAGDGNPWGELARPMIGDAAFLAGVDYAPPAAGPDMAGMAAIAALPAEEQAAAIAGMVEGLSTRLAQQGGSAEEWAMLIRALGVQGETGQALAIWTEAQSVFAGREGDLATLRAAASEAGVE